MKSWAGGHESVCSSIGTRVGNNGNNGNIFQSCVFHRRAQCRTTVSLKIYPLYSFVFDIMRKLLFL